MNRARSVHAAGFLGVSVLGLALLFWVDASAQAEVDVGATATYRWTSARMQPVPVLIRDTVSGGEAKWSVADQAMPPPPLFVTYGIVRGDRTTYTLQIVTRERLDGQPLSVTQVTVNRRSGHAVRSVIQSPKGFVATPESGLRPLRESEVEGALREEVVVPAGRFSTARGSVWDAQVWVSDQVPPLGLVRAVWPSSGTLDLVQSATTGAQDLMGPRRQ